MEKRYAKLTGALLVKSAEKPRAKQTGMTLIELMIVVAIIGIIFAVALPNYQDSVQKTRRSDAVEALMKLAVKQENFYSQHGTYTTDIISTAGLNNESSTSKEGYYILSAEAEEGRTIASSYLLKAVAIGGQLGDENCASFTIDSKNRQSALTQSGTATAQCW